MTTERKTAYNSTYKKLAVLCYVETFVVYGYLVLRNYIRAESRQLLVGAKRYTQPIPHLSKKKKIEYVPRLGIFVVENLIIMAKNTSILLGDYFDGFINQQVKSGKFSSASEVVRAALRMYEFEETKKAELINELKKGEKSGFVEKFKRETFLKSLHKNHLAEK